MTRSQMRKLCQQLINRKELYCYLCGMRILNAKHLSFDHIVAKSKADVKLKKTGTQEDMLMPTHKCCNGARQNMSLFEWFITRGGER